MTLGEGSIINGTGSQTAGGNRWGDYTAIDIDPTDDMTFWYINEYVPTTSAAGWRLRIGAFNLAGGGSPTPTPTASPSSTPTADANCYPFGLSIHLYDRHGSDRSGNDRHGQPY